MNSHSHQRSRHTNLMVSSSSPSRGSRAAASLGWLLCSLMMAALLLLVHPTASLAAPGLDQTAEPIQVVGRLPMNLNPSEQQEFERRTLALAAITRTKDPVTSYSCNADIEHPGTYVFVETWPSELALNNHLQTSHFKDWWQWVEPHLSGDLVINAAPTADFFPIS